MTSQHCSRNVAEYSRSPGSCRFRSPVIDTLSTFFSPIWAIGFVGGFSGVRLRVLVFFPLVEVSGRPACFSLGFIQWDRFFLLLDGPLEARLPSFFRGSGEFEFIESVLPASFWHIGEFLGNAIGHGGYLLRYKSRISGEQRFGKELEE